MTVLAGDIGGTKTLLALFERHGERLRETARKKYASGDWRDFSDLLTDFLGSCGQPALEAATIGVAGPVIAGECRTTNLPWIVRADDLHRRLGTDAVFLLNDLQATGYGMLHLRDSDFAVLNKGRSVSGNAAVIAAGTGLGEGILFLDSEGRWHPLATEGGHCEFAPQNEIQDALLAWLRQRYPEHVSVERILSGPGLEDLYRFIGEFRRTTAPEKDARTITADALASRDPLCRETLVLFAEIYGAEAGNLALKCLARGGVYLGGGIAPKILPILQEGHFLRGFSAKGRFRGLLEEMPVSVSMSEETALLGAARYAIDHA